MFSEATRAAAHADVLLVSPTEDDMQDAQRKFFAVVPMNFARLQRKQPRLVDGMAYTHSTATDISKTFERHGFKPTTDAERAERNAKHRGE
jgi:hypothetical protein